MDKKSSDPRSDAEYWIGAFGDLQMPAVATMPTTFCLIAYFLFGIKTISGGGFEDGLYYGLGSIMFLGIFAFILVPLMISYIGGLTSEGLEDNRVKCRIKLSYVIVSLFLMAGVVLQGLSGLGFLQVHFGSWAYISVEVKVLMLFVRFAMCLIEFLLLRNLYVVCCH